MRIKEQETHLTLQEHDDDDDDMIALNPSKTKKMDAAPRFWEQHFFLRSIHASPLCPSGKSNVLMKMSREHWWNDTDSRKTKYSEKYLSQCHFIDHNSQMD